MTSIIFAPSHDGPTAANAAVARGMASNVDIPLIGGDATRHLLLGAMADHDGFAMVIMAHGTEDGILDGDDSYALDLEDCPRLAGRRVFAFACNTSLQLGGKAAESGATWIGYRCPVTAPSEAEELVPEFRALFTDIKDEFRNIECSETADQFLLWLEERCNASIASFDRALQECNEFSILLCCAQIWQQVEVRLPGGGGPIRHPHAPAPYILI